MLNHYMSIKQIDFVNDSTVLKENNTKQPNLLAMTNGRNRSLRDMRVLWSAFVFWQ